MSFFLEDLRTKPASQLLSEVVIEVTGPDAKQFLNSQTSNNVLELEDNKFQFNLVLDLSGKIVTSFLLTRINEETYVISVANSQVDQCLERLSKFHISEDLELSKQHRSTYININSTGAGVSGIYFFENDKLSFNTALETLNKDISSLSLLTGVPHFGSHQGDLVNNTFFDELAVDYSKGCFPGQETVAKINTRRGAAYKPVLGIASKEFDILEVNGKKVGKIKECQKIGDKFYHRVEVLRNYRINKSEVAGMVLHYYPYIAVTTKELANDYYDEAMEYFKSNEDSEAIRYFEKAISLNSQFEDAYESLGVLHGRLGNFDSAIELMEKLREINPKSMMAYTNLSLYHMKQGHIDIAEDFKSQATLLNFELLGDEAEKKKKQEEIEKQKAAERDRREGMFKQVLEMDSEDAMANNGMGEILLEKGDIEEAGKHFAQAIEADMKYSVAYLGLAKCYVTLNRLSELKEVLVKGIEVAGKNGDLMPANEMQSLKSRYVK